jgi:hypothetical protein
MPEGDSIYQTATVLRRVLKGKRVTGFDTTVAQVADRRTLYNTIIKADKLQPAELGGMQRLFANSWRDKSPPGWRIQQDNGQWVRK